MAHQPNWISVGCFMMNALFDQAFSRLRMKKIDQHQKNQAATKRVWSGLSRSVSAVFGQPLYIQNAYVTLVDGNQAMRFQLVQHA